MTNTEIKEIQKSLMNLIIDNFSEDLHEDKFYYKWEIIWILERIKKVIDNL